MNDVVHINLSQLDFSIEQLEKLCNQEQISNNRQVQSIVHKLFSEDWVGSADGEAFRDKFAEYQRNLDKMASFYDQIITDLKKIRSDMAQQINNKPNIHTDGF